MLTQCCVFGGVFFLVVLIVASLSHSSIPFLLGSFRPYASFQARIVTCIHSKLYQMSHQHYLFISHDFIGAHGVNDT